jgi:hypothetical protein
VSDEVADKVRAHFRSLDLDDVILQAATLQNAVDPSAANQGERFREPSGKLTEIIMHGGHGDRADARAWANVLGQVRFELMSLLDKLDKKRLPGESPNDRVKRLSFEESKLPSPIGALMRSLIAFRNSSEYEAYVPSATEADAIKAICVALDDYGSGLG